MKRRLRFSCELEVEVTDAFPPSGDKDFDKTQRALLEAIKRTPEALDRLFLDTARSALAAFSEGLEGSALDSQRQDRELMALLEPHLDAELSAWLYEAVTARVFFENTQGVLLDAWRARVLDAQLTEVRDGEATLMQAFDEQGRPL